MYACILINFRSCEEIKAKAAELNEMCRSKSFDVQRLIPAIKVKTAVKYCLI